MSTTVNWLERHQVMLYLAALAAGTATGLLVPEGAQPAQLAITPVLGLLLYSTFLSVPFINVRQASRDWRFLGAIGVLNFAVVPAVVCGLSRFVAHDQVLLMGVLFVLLTPCVDYVIAFTGLAGGAKDRLLAITPLLMVAQMLLLPLYLWLFTGTQTLAAINFAPFIEAFVWLIALPLLAAVLTQYAARRSALGARLRDTALGAMVPLLMLTLAVVVAAHIAGVGQRIVPLLSVIPVYVAFACIMVPLGMLASRFARLDVSGSRAVVFSGVTRNSLVVLPLVLALPAAFDLAPLVVVAQTLVELVVMVVLVRLLPRLLPLTAVSHNKNP